MSAEKIDIPFPTTEGLVDNTVRFSNLLRDSGISVSLPEMFSQGMGLFVIVFLLLVQRAVLGGTFTSEWAPG